jgi:hypothetical protein
MCVGVQVAWCCHWTTVRRCGWRLKGDSTTAQMVRCLQFLRPAQRVGLCAFKAVQEKPSGELNPAKVLGYGVKTSVVLGNTSVPHSCSYRKGTTAP